MTEPLISVIVPVYKVEPWLDRCIDSIRNQTYRNLEIILVDDGSPDRCGDMCDEYALADERITVIHRSNGGLSAARNTGLAACHGEYIGFVDSDDVIHQEMYARLYADICANETCLAFCQTLMCYNAVVCFPAADSKVKCLSKDEVLRLSLERIMWFSAWSKLYHKSLFDSLHYPEGRTNEDYPVTIRIFDRCDRIAVDFNKLYGYCKREGSITTSSSAQNAFDQILSSEEVMSYIAETHPDLVSLAARILLSSCLGFLLKTDGKHEDVVKTMRDKSFNVIRTYYPKEKRNPYLRFSQRILLSAANAGELPFALASWMYRTKHRSSAL